MKVEVNVPQTALGKLESTLNAAGYKIVSFENTRFTEDKDRLACSKVFRLLIVPCEIRPTVQATINLQD